MGSVSLPWLASGSRLAPVVHSVMNVNVSTSNQEMNMSQKAYQNAAPKHAPTLEHDPQAPIVGVSPDDPLPVPSDDTGKPGLPQK